MKKLRIEIETDDVDVVSASFMEKKDPQENDVIIIGEDANLHYAGSMYRKTFDVLNSCYFFLDFLKESIAGAIVVRIVTWLFDKLTRQKNTTLKLKIEGRDVEKSKDAIAKAIEFALTEPSIEDQIQSVVSEIELFPETIISLANERRLAKEEFFKPHPCAQLWGVHEFYSVIVSSLGPKLEDITRLMHLCIGPIAPSRSKEKTDS